MKKGNSSSYSDQRGAALVIAILALLIIGVLAVAFMSTGATSQEISQNSHEQTEAFFIAEAGLTHGTRMVLPANPSTYDSILQNQLAGLTDPVNFGAGDYRVTVLNDTAEIASAPTDDTNKRIIVRSVGTGADGATVTMEALVAAGVAHALLVNAPLLISGDMKLLGTGGSMHANGQLTISGNPCVAGTATSSSQVTVGGSIRQGSCSGVGSFSGNQGIVPPPTWDMRSAFRDRADFILGIDGRVTNSSGTVVHNSSTQGNDWNLNFTGSGCGSGDKFTWDPGNQRWVHGGTCIPAGRTWYSAGNLELPNEVGLTTPVTATFVAEGSIVTNGSPRFAANPNLDGGRYAFMAGRDLRISGNPASGSYSSSGIHYANDQIQFSGNPRINGVVIAANLTDNLSMGCNCNPVPRVNGTRVEISGNPEITYNGGLIDDGARVISWREIRY